MGRMGDLLTRPLGRTMLEVSVPGGQAQRLAKGTEPKAMRFVDRTAPPHGMSDRADNSGIATEVRLPGKLPGRGQAEAAGFQVRIPLPVRSGLDKDERSPVGTGGRETGARAGMSTAPRAVLSDRHFPASVGARGTLLGRREPTSADLVAAVRGAGERKIVGHA